ncbi:MAG: LacI family DNA-binding transcriptional regulator [Phototrophicaceae bacterium]
MKRPTQVDVARLAGVSRATVSYVLNDPTNQKVPISPETRQRVLKVIAELGYEVDARAQALRSGDTRAIGVLLPMYENPYFWQMLNGIATEAEANGYSLLLAHNSLTPEQENQSIRELAEQRVDGLVLMIGFKMLPEQVVTQLRNSSRPIVEISGTASSFDYVYQGYGDGARALMAHLLELGHRRIGFVYGVVLAAQGFDRLDAYRQMLEQAGIAYDETLVYQCGQHLEDGYQATLTLLNQPNRPTAILAINDLLGMAAIRAAVDLGLRVPQDVSIASFDDIPFSPFMVPRLTSISGNPEENGRDAVRLLIQRINDPERPHEVIASGWQLHIRESTGVAPQGSV